MNNTHVWRIVIGIIFIITGCAVFFIHSDQEIINLTPSNGPGLLVPIKSEHIYKQTFAVQGQSISKIGAYIMPIHVSAKTSQGAIRIDLLQNGIVQATGSIPVFRIDTDDVTIIRVSPPVSTSRGEFLTMQITAAPEASGLVALRKRVFDETFLHTDSAFTVNDTGQEYPIAHKAFASVWLPFVQQVGGMFIIVGMIFLLWEWVKKAKNTTAILTLCAVIGLYAIPSYKTHPLFVLLAAILLVASWVALRISGRTILASAFGAIILACSTWLPLYLITEGSSAGSLSIRDALLDPNQISVSHGAGGYIGIPAAVFAAAGVFVWLLAIIKKRFVALQLDSSMAALFALSLLMTFIPSPFQRPKGIIIVVFCIAWFASLALDRLQRFLGLRDMFIQTLVSILIIISLLDLMHITTRTFTYGLGL